MADTAAKLAILIDIQAKLGELLRSQEAFRQAKEEAQGFGNMLRTGLGIDIARRGLEVLKSSITQSIGEALRAAGAIKDLSEALGLTTTEYQVLSLEFKEAGADTGRLTEAISAQTRSLAEARDVSSSAAKAYSALGLSAREVERMPVAERLIAVARAMQGASDHTTAFGAAAQIVGSRGLPQLLNALQRLARDGLEVVSQGWVGAGQVMSEDTIARLDRATKAWEGLWRGIVTQSGEALAAIQRFMFAEKTAPMLGAQQRVWELEAGMAAQRKAGKEPSQRDREMLAAARAQYAQAAVALGDEANIRAARAGVQQIAPGDGGLLSAMDRKAIADVEAAYQRLEAASSAAKAQAAKTAAAAAETKAAMAELSEAEQADADALARQEEQRLRLQQIFDENNRQWETARQVVEANLAPLERYNRELDRLAQLEGMVSPDVLARARTAAGDRLKADQDAELDKSLGRFFGGMDEYSRNTVPGAAPAPEARRPSGAMEGFMAWSEQIGTTGNQVADAINGTVGESVRGVSAELANWAVTGKMSGDALRQVGFSIFTGWIQSIVQMGVQWLVTQTLIKTGLLTTDALQTTLLAKKTAEVNAANAATLPANSANAAAASVSSFGLAAVVGLAALLAVMAMFGGFRERGGDVAPGRAYVVGERRPEVFVPHEAGTIVPSVGSYIRASPGLGRAAPVSAGAGSDGGGAAGAAARPTMVIALADGISDVRRLKRQPGWEDAIVETVQRRRGEILS